MDNAAVTRCVGGYYVWLAFGDSESLRSSEGHNLRITLHDSRSSEHVVSRGLKFGGQSQRRISFNRPIMATDDSSSSRSSDYAGKSSMACALSRALYNRGKLSYILDGDNVRHGLNSDLSFKAEDRAENVRRVGEVAKLFADAGIICIASLISPYRKERAACRALLPEGDLLRFCNNAEDPKGLYKRARAGEIKGIDDPYEPPLNCEIVMQNNKDKGFSSSSSLPEMAEIVVSYLDQNGYLKPS
ncbi:hypothetical protein YC2023_105699 [Brassica napus]